MGRRSSLVALELVGSIICPGGLEERARAYMNQSKSRNTRRAYKADWADFSQWAAERGFDALPAFPEAVGLYLTDRAATLKVSSLQRRLSAISQAHRLAGHKLDLQHPAIREVWQGIRRAHGAAQEGKAPVMTEDLRRMVGALPDSLLGLRDRALLLAGFAGAFRRSELVGLDFGDVDFTSAGVVVTIRRSKTDQTGQGIVRGLPYGSNPETCPVRSLQAWIEAAGIEDGSLFRSITRHGRIGGRLSGKAVALVVKRAAKAAGLDPERFSGHSLRAGLATSAAAAGVDPVTIAGQTGHKRLDTLRGYIRLGSLFRDNAAGRVGL